VIARIEKENEKEEKNTSFHIFIIYR
jgi:hypothetical protein